MQLIELTEKQLEAVEEMAAHGFSIDEIADVVCYDASFCDASNQSTRCLFIDEFITGGRVATFYRKGFLQQQLELRKRIFKDAKNGSSPAQMLAKKILDDAEYKSNNP